MNPPWHCHILTLTIDPITTHPSLGTWQDQDHVYKDSSFALLLMKSRADGEIPKMENRTSSPGASLVVIMITMRLSMEATMYRVRLTRRGRNDRWNAYKSMLCPRQCCKGFEAVSLELCNESSIIPACHYKPSYRSDAFRAWLQSAWMMLEWNIH